MLKNNLCSSFLSVISENNHRSEILIIGLILIVSTIFIGTIGIYGYGDGSSYYLMAGSLIKDGDLILNNKDIARWNQHRFHNVPVGAYVIVNGKGIMKYAKPILYPLIAAPFFFFGNTGFIILNGLLLGGSIALSYLFLRRYFNKNNSLVIATLFFLCSFIPVYATWTTQEMMLFFACSLYMWLWLYKNKTALAALIVGIVSSAKIMFLLLLLPLIVILALKKKFKELFKIIGMCSLGMSTMLILTFFFLGRLLPYSGLRGYIPPSQTPYLTVEKLRDTLFITPSQFEGIEFNSLGLFFRNILNFFIGRFTGIIWYAFPGVVCVVVYLLNRRKLSKGEKILGDSILGVMLLLILTLIIARPLNYFGGRGFVCNRYFFILPALLFLPGIRSVKKPEKIALLFLPGLLISFQIIKNVILIKNWGIHRWRRTYTFPHGAHTRTFPLKYAPLEIPQVESFVIHNVKFSDTIFLYAPSGLRRQKDKKVLIDAGGEVVIVQKNSSNYLKLQTDHDEIILQPKIILKSKASQECRSFYYFKAERPTWINNISLIHR